MLSLSSALKVCVNDYTKNPSIIQYRVNRCLEPVSDLSPITTLFVSGWYLANSNANKGLMYLTEARLTGTIFSVKPLTRIGLPKRVTMLSIHSNRIRTTSIDGAYVGDLSCRHPTILPAGLKELLIYSNPTFRVGVGKCLTRLVATWCRDLKNIRLLEANLVVYRTLVHSPLPKLEVRSLHCLAYTVSGCIVVIYVKEKAMRRLVYTQRRKKSGWVEV